MMMVVARRDEGRLLAVFLLQLEAEHTAVKIEGALQVGDLEVDVADADCGGDWLKGRGHRTKLILLRKIAKAAAISR
jgi:hypothetical protein